MYRLLPRNHANKFSKQYSIKYNYRKMKKIESKHISIVMAPPVLETLIVGPPHIAVLYFEGSKMHFMLQAQENFTN